MSQVNYAEMVHALAKPGDAIVQSLTPAVAHLLHMAVGISGESGELLDAIKKVAIYNKPIDAQNVIEELGDIEFYLEGLRQGLCVTREQCIEANIAKLSKRYNAGTYSDNAAQARADKTIDTIVDIASKSTGIPKSLIVGGSIEDVHDGSEA